MRRVAAGRAAADWGPFVAGGAEGGWERVPPLGGVGGNDGGLGGEVGLE